MDSGTKKDFSAAGATVNAVEAAREMALFDWGETRR
jgi:hypothetical protein